MKIKKVTEEMIVFDNATVITYDHCQDCCEDNYADFKQIESDWSEEALSVMETIDSQQDVIITCPKCHGKGSFDVPIFDYGEFSTRYENRECEVCKKWEE